MADFWKLGAMAWCLTVLSWFLVPVITFVVNKLFAYLSVDVERKLKELEIHTIPNLKQTLMDVQDQMMLRAAKGKGSESDLKILDTMNKDLKSALYDAEDILDLVGYHRIEKEIIGDKSIWMQRLRDAVGACIARCKGSQCFGRCTCIARAARLRCAQGLSRLQLVALCRWAIPSRNPEEQPSHDLEGGGTYSVAQRLRSLFLGIYNCCRSILGWLADVIEVLSTYRDWSYDVVGIKHNKKDGVGLDSFLLTTDRKKLRERLENMEYIVTAWKTTSHLLNHQSSSNKVPVKDTDNESSNRLEEVDDLRRRIEQKVFGRDKERDSICQMLRVGPDAGGPSSSSSKRYSVIGIYGMPGSGKSTLAQYICDYEEAEGKNFDIFMFIHLHKTFRLDRIFRDMLKLMNDTKHLQNQLKELKHLQNQLKENLKGKRFLLVLDDLWVNDENQEETDILLDALAAGDAGSRILVTAQNEEAAAALGAQDQLKIHDLEEEDYLSLFMHHALRGTVDGHGKFEKIGKKIARKLHRSPIAAVTVAKRLQRNKSIHYWETTENLVLNETMGALRWSYQQLGADVRRCFEYCSTFPRGYELERHVLVDMWVAQGFVKTSNETEELEDVGQRYFEELLTFSFLQEYIGPTGGKVFKLHDMFHELAEKVAGSDFFRIGGNGFDTRQGIPRDVRHLFIETCDGAEIGIPRDVRHLFIETCDGAEMITDGILELEKLRTLIIIEERLNLVKEKTFEGMFKKMTQLRVLSVKVKQETPVFSFPESIGQLKHLRYLAYDSYGGSNHMNLSWATRTVALGYITEKLILELIFPSSFTKLYQMQILDVPDDKFTISYPEYMTNLIHLRKIPGPVFPNIRRLTSLQKIQVFRVKNEPGYELKQLQHLNRLRGYLHIAGLETVRSKDEAVEANLAGKKRLTQLSLVFKNDSPSPDTEAEVLEGLCPPKDLENLFLFSYSGSRYPSWMLSRRNPEAPKQLHRLDLYRCSRLVSIPEDSEFFATLHSFNIVNCTWDALPDHMEHLTSLRRLEIVCCDNIELLPALPQSLQRIRIVGENMLRASFQDETHINWQRIQHISEKLFIPHIDSGFPAQLSTLGGEGIARPDYWMCLVKPRPNYSFFLISFPTPLLLLLFLTGRMLLECEGLACKVVTVHLPPLANSVFCALLDSNN